MIYLISHRSTSNIALQTIIWFLSFSLKTHNFLQIDAESGSLWTLLCNKKIQHMLLSPCSSTFMSSNNLDYLMLRYGNNQIIMNISCMYRTCALTSDTHPCATNTASASKIESPNFLDLQSEHVEALGAGYNARQAICSKTIFSAPVW